MIVTTFTAGAQNTLPIWIFGAIRLGQQLPEVNVVVTFVLAADGDPRRHRREADRRRRHHTLIGAVTADGSRRHPNARRETVDSRR